MTDNRDRSSARWSHGRSARLDYWQTVVAGECVDPSTIRVARDDETIVDD